MPLRVEKLANAPLPALVLDRAGNHFILAKTDGKTALILEAGSPAPDIRPRSEASTPQRLA